MIRMIPVGQRSPSARRQTRDEFEVPSRPNGDDVAIHDRRNQVTWYGAELIAISTHIENAHLEAIWQIELGKPSKLFAQRRSTADIDAVSEFNRYFNRRPSRCPNDQWRHRCSVDDSLELIESDVRGTIRRDTVPNVAECSDRIAKQRASGAGISQLLADHFVFGRKPGPGDSA